MKMIKNNFLIILLSVLVLASCQNDSIRPNVPIGLYENGYFVTNEGNFGTGNGSLSFIDDRGSVSNNIFAQTNSFSLGDVVQSMEIINEKAYIVVNNSSKIEVANIDSMAHVATINGLISPRYILQVSNERAYISDWGIGGIHVLDLNTNSIISNISTGQGPEKMLIKDNKAYICNVGGFGLDNTVSVIDTENDVLITNINVGDKPNSIVEDANGNIWVLAGGNTEYDANWNVVAETPGELTTINSETNNVDGSVVFEVGDHPKDLIIDDNGTTLYFSNGSWSKSVYSFNIYNNMLSENPIINKSFYSLGYNDNHIYGTDVKDYVQNGWTYKFNTNGQVVDSNEVGIIPGGYCFR
tara:strand:- start:9 stop:1073 length:1065 start_codon:yes stop_codon:yes gene_type:complete